MIQRLGYRIGQVFLRCSRPSAQLLAEVRQLLGDCCWDLYKAMPRGDRVHVLAVYQRLGSKGLSPDVLIAALLHDVGKTSAGLTTLHRALCVVLARFWPALLGRLGEIDVGWHRPFYVHLHHAELGADACVRCGCSDTVVWLVRHHEDEMSPQAVTPRAAWLLNLQEADDRS